MATYNGTSNDDVLYGGNWADSISGRGGNDTLYGGGGSDVINGEAGDDLLYGGAGADSLYGGTGNDTLVGGASNDLLDGGDGIDTADYSSSGSGVDVSLETGSGSGGDAARDVLRNIENLVGSNSADTLTGDSGHNRLDGGAGNDRLYGGAGNDTLIGGQGADTLYGGQGLDIADYSASNAGVNIDLAAETATGGHATGDVIAGIDGIIGSAYNDTLLGFDGQFTSGDDIYTNVFYGAGGDDSIDGRGANDDLFGGIGNDTILGGSGDDRLYGEEGNDRLFGGDGQDSLDGGTGNDSLDGGAGNDELQGGAGRDTLSGGTGNDYLDGGADHDQLAGGSGDDSLYGDLGNDTLSGDAGQDLLYGGAGHDSLSGGDGRDYLDGGDGNDTLLGGAGNDTLIGGAGNDSLVGGDDRDLFYAGLGDTIDGGEGGEDFDRIDLTGLGPRRIIRDPSNPENGVIEFLDPWGNVTGTITFRNIESITCFTPGTRIVTDRGEVPVEALEVGQRVLTRDHGQQVIRWIGSRRLGIGELIVDPSLQPVRIRKGALGAGLPERDLMVSRQHRMLLTGPRAELMFGVDEVLVRALHLVGLPGIEFAVEKEVTYLHLLFDRHELILSDGAWSESFQPAERNLSGLDDPSRREVLKLFPELAERALPRSFDSARMTLKAHEAKVLLGV